MDVFQDVLFDMPPDCQILVLVGHKKHPASPFLQNFKSTFALGLFQPVAAFFRCCSNYHRSVVNMYVYTTELLVHIDEFN